MLLLLRKINTMSRWSSCGLWEKTLKRTRSQVKKSCRNSKQRLRLAATTCHRFREVWDYDKLTWLDKQCRDEPLAQGTDHWASATKWSHCYCFLMTFLCSLKSKRNFSTEMSWWARLIQAWWICLFLISLNPKDDPVKREYLASNTAGICASSISVCVY